MPFCITISSLAFPHNANTSLEIYPNYIFWNPQFSSYSELSFATDNKVYVKLDNEDKLYIGNWYVDNDTLCIIEDRPNWVWTDGETQSDYEINDRYIQLWIVLPALQYFDLNNKPYPYSLLSGDMHTQLGTKSLSKLTIKNHGDSLIYKIGDHDITIGIPLSSKESNKRHEDFDTIPSKTEWMKYPDSLKRAKPRFYHPLNPLCEVKPIDTLTWKSVKAPNTNLFEVMSVNMNRDTIVSVWAKCDDITFHILNPTAYHQPAVAPFNANREYSDWMAEVRPGQWLRLQLARPNYGDSAIARSPYLGGWPDSVAVMDNEAYGYWFARPLLPDSTTK